MSICIYTDGSARNNGYKNSSGGFGVVVLEIPDFCRDDSNAKLIRVFQQQTSPTTNNKEEMKAIIWAMENYGKDSLGMPIVYTDSNYSLNTFTKWMWAWKDNGWRRSNNLVPENLDIVQHYDKLVQDGYRIQLEKVHGHSGNKWNELADMLATYKINEEEAMRRYGNR